MIGACSCCGGIPIAPIYHCPKYFDTLAWNKCKAYICNDCFKRDTVFSCSECKWGGLNFDSQKNNAKLINRNVRKLTFDLLKFKHSCEKSQPSNKLIDQKNKRKKKQEEKASAQNQIFSSDEKIYTYEEYIHHL